MASTELKLNESSNEEKSIPNVSRSNPTSEIPNGGVLAWIQCAGSFFLFFNCWGVVNTFGVYQTFYERSLLPYESSSNISWIGSIQSFLLIFVGIFVGPLFDHGYFRSLILIGSFGVVFGMMMTSLCTKYWQIVLSQGVVVGLGCGFLFVPSIAIIPYYFSTQKALAQGIAACGSSLGGIIYPILFQNLQTRIGFPWATRVMAFVILATLIMPIVCMKVRVRPGAARRLIDSSAWQETPFLLLSVAEFLGFMGLYIPFFYVQLYAIQKTDIDEHLAFYLVTLLNAGSLFGRLLPNFIADKIGPINVLIPCILTAAVLAFAWIGITTPAGIIVFCLLYGYGSRPFFTGSFVSLPPTIVFTLSPSLSVYGTRNGMLFLPISFGLLIGNPIAGAILRSGWRNLEAFCGATIAVSGGFITATRVAKAGLAVKVRA